jgi:translocation and assembly module TamB
MANWKKALAWTAVIIGALLVLLIVAGVLIARSSAFHHYLLAKIIQQTSEATGARVELVNFDVHPRALTADVYGLTVHGSEPAGEKPLLQVKKATVGLKIISILQRKVNLSELIIENPAVNLMVNREGRSNLPVPPPSNKKSSTNIFDLAVGHVLLTDGSINFRDRKLPLDANLFGLGVEIRFSQLERKYSGRLGYHSGTIHYAPLKALPHGLEASFDATPSELNLKPLVVFVGGSKFLLEATLNDYDKSPVARGRYHLVLHTQDFAGLSTTATAGDLTLAGTMNYREQSDRPLLRNVSLDGTLQSNGLNIASEQALLKIEKLSGNYRLANGNFRAQGFAVHLLNGTLTADGVVEHVDENPRSRFHLELAKISLAQLKSSLRGYSTPSVAVSGTLQASADASLTGSELKTLKANSHLLVAGAVGTANGSRQQTFPLNADVRVNYDGGKNLVSVPTGQIQLPATTITAQGDVGDHSSLRIAAVSTNLHQLMLVASGLSSSGAASNPSAMNIQGAATLNALVAGSIDNPRITAQLSATKLEVNQGQFSSLRCALAAAPSGVSIENGVLEAVPRGQLQFSGSVALKRWAYLPSQPLKASVAIRQMPLAMLDQLATQSYPITGNLDGKLELYGSELDPRGQGKLEVTNARVQDEPLQTVTLEFTASGGTIRSQLSEAANRVLLNYTPKSKAYEARVEVPPFELSTLHALKAKNLPVKGQLSISAQGSGTLDNPALNASLQLARLELRQTSVSLVKLDLNVSNHLARFNLDSSGGPANLRGQGSVRLSPGYYAEASLDTSRFPLDPLLALYLPSRPNGLTGETELHASIRGPLADQSRVEAHLTIPSFQAAYQSLAFATTGPIRVDYSNSLVVLQPSGFKGTGTALEFSGRANLQPGGRINLSARGSIDLRLAQMLNPEVQSGGSIQLNVDAGGTVKNPGMNGQIRIQNASFATQEVPVGIENLNATMRVTDTGVEITNAVGQMGGGQIRFGGSVAYRPELQASLSLSAKSVRFRYPEGTRTVFDSDLTLTGNSQAATLAGRVLIDSLSFTSDFDLSTFMSQFTGTSAPPTGQSLADKLRLDIAVQTSSQLNAGTAELGIEGQANLRIIGTASDPVVVGRADLASGDLFFMRRQYHLEHGVINFVNPNKTEPMLNMLITTTINQYNLSISVIGPIEKLQTNYVSDPPLPPVDIINLIARGQTTTEGAPESLGASTVLAQGLSQVESTVGSNISKLTGISGLQIDPAIGGNNTNPSARLGIQKRVTKNFIFTFSTDVTQPQNEIVQGEYELNKRWSVSVVRNASGGFAVDGRYHTHF